MNEMANPAAIAKLEPADYWEWRTDMAELSTTKFELQAQELRFEMLLKDIEIARLKAAIFKKDLESYKTKKDTKDVEYKEMVKRLESKYGVEDISKCVINENLEIVKIDE